MNINPVAILTLISNLFEQLAEAQARIAQLEASLQARSTPPSD